jgi:hypothetical protein
MGHEEQDYLQKLCHSILNAEKTIRFAGIIDDRGKLLIGKYRSDISSSLLNANIDNETKATSFYTAYQMLAINNRFRSDLGMMRFQLTEFGRVTLVSVPLTAQNNRFLCISLDSPARHEKVIPRILDIVG